MHNISVCLNIYLKNMQIDTRRRGRGRNVPYAKPFEFTRTNEQPENAYANVQKIPPRCKITSLVSNVPLKYTYSRSLRSISFLSLAFTVNISLKILVLSKTVRQKCWFYVMTFIKYSYKRDKERERDGKREDFCRKLREGRWISCIY